MTNEVTKSRFPMSQSNEKYWSKKLPDDTIWDYIVIGSGMGGMTSAAFLSKLGFRVLVLEQHYVPGGFTHMFKRKNYEWDVGVHAVGEVTSHSMTGRLLAELTDGGLKWNSLGPVYDEFYYPDGFEIQFPDSPGQFRENLLEAFPHEGAAIDQYLQSVREVSSAMKGYYIAKAAPKMIGSTLNALTGRKAQAFLETKTLDAVQQMTRNEKLQSIFTAQWGYYGSPPHRSSYAMQALVVKHFLHGGYYPVGGAREIARNLLGTVAKAGGWTCIRTAVEKIIVERGKVQGVVTTGGDTIRAKKIISAVGVQSTISRLLPSEYQRDRELSAIRDLAPAPAHVCLYLGFKGDIRSAGASSANKWFYDTWDHSKEVWDIAPQNKVTPGPILYCSFPSLKDPIYDPGPDQRHTGEVVTFVPWSTFAPWLGTKWMKRGEEYADFKERITEVLLEQFLEQMPGLRPMLDHVELSTPLSTDNFCRPMHGSIYGIEPTPQRFKTKALRPKSDIKGLYFSGSEVATVGVIGAMMGGVMGVIAAEPAAAIPFMTKVSR
jgi:all-trans-retinol 13,14-reductase